MLPSFQHSFVLVLAAIVAGCIAPFGAYATEKNQNYGSAPKLVPLSAIVTGTPGEKIANSQFTWAESARHLYSKVQPWNCDESLLWLSNQDDRGTQVFLTGDGKTVHWVGPAPGSEMRWLPRSRNTLFFVNNNTVGLWNIETEKTTIIYRFETLGALRIGPYEGNISRDGQWVVLSGVPVVKPATELHSVLFNIRTANVFSEYKHPSNTNIDWVSVSASGRFIVENSRVNNTHSDTTQVYDMRFNKVGSRWLGYGRPSHYDLSIDSSGDDVAVGVSKSAPDDGNLIKRRLRDGKVTSLIAHGYARHTSARAVSTENWVLATYEGDLIDWPPFSNELVAYSLGTGVLKRVLSYKSSPQNYWSQAQAVISPSGKRVAWAQSSGEAEEQRVGLAVAKTGLAFAQSNTAQMCEPAP